MVFSSIPFVYYFLPIVIILYFLSPKVLKNAVLLFSSLIFYGWGEPKYVFLMIASVGVNYVLGLLIEKFRNRKFSKIFLAVSVMFSLGLLCYFKYADFFIENFSKVTGINVKTLNIALPIGISFYTFQILSYTIDVYRGSVKAQKNPIFLGTYIALFPQLIAGPIVRYIDVEKQLAERSHTFEQAAIGIQRFVVGFSKKIILANSFGELCSNFYASDEKTVLYSWIFALAYMLQVYFDFSGYSDMAIGLGKIFGFDFPENFRYPFVSQSISEFWRRWHISLGTWFRDYVYIPMGGNRVGKIRFFINVFTVWLLTGFWHGAEWNFIVWGIYFAVFLMIEKLFLSEVLKNVKIINHIYVLFVTAVSFVIFSTDGFNEAVSAVGRLFGIGGIPVVGTGEAFVLKNYGFALIVGVFASTPAFVKIRGFLSQKKYVNQIIDAVEIPVLLILFLVSTGFLADGTFNPFLYFRF